MLTPELLIERFRSDVSDLLTGPADAPDNDALWKILDVEYYLLEAMQTFATRTSSIRKRFKLTYSNTVGEPLLRFPSAFKVLDIDYAFSHGGNRQLHETNQEDFRFHRDYGVLLNGAPFPNTAATASFANTFLRDYDGRGILLYPIPTNNDIIEISAGISPLSLPCGVPLPIDEATDVHLVLLWMKKLAYEKHDADTFDPQRAQAFEKEFEVRIVDRKSDAERRRRAPGRVRFAW